jgi:phosphoserine phosphatase RsbU/P
MSADDAAQDFHAALLDDDPQALYERAPCGYLSTTPDGTIIKVNQTFLTLTGFAREELLGRRTFAELLTAGGRIYHETHYAPMLRMQGDAREIALDIVCADRRRLPVLVNSVLERDDAGTPLVVRTAVFDATDRREYERELLRAKERAEASEARASLLAQTLQQTLIPPTPPDIPGLEVGAVYRPAGSGEEVGGDFYDIFELAPGDWAVAVGDVCGKGVEAAVITALARHTIRAAAVNEQRPSQILAILNEVVLRSDADRFCTVVLLRLRLIEGQWTATISRGGHPPPILVAANRHATTITPPGSLLGMLRNPRLSDIEVPLEPGSTLVLYTDGITEGPGEAGLYGEERLLATVEHLVRDRRPVAAGVLDDALDYQRGDPRDDAAVVSIAVPAR